MPNLYPEDQEKVDEYLSASIHQVERKPFNGWVLLMIIFFMLGLFTLISYLVAKSHGVI